MPRLILALVLFVINVGGFRSRFFKGMGTRTLLARFARGQLLQKAVEGHAREDARELIEQVRRKAHLLNRVSARDRPP